MSILPDVAQRSLFRRAFANHSELRARRVQVVLATTGRSHGIVRLHSGGQAQLPPCALLFGDDCAASGRILSAIQARRCIMTIGSQPDQTIGAALALRPHCGDPHRRQGGRSSSRVVLERASHLRAQTCGHRRWRSRPCDRARHSRRTWHETSSLICGGRLRSSAARWSADRKCGWSSASIATWA